MIKYNGILLFLHFNILINKINLNLLLIASIETSRHLFINPELVIPQVQQNAQSESS